MKKHPKPVRALPVPRKLLAGSIAYLTGIYLTEALCLPAWMMAVIGAFFTGLALLRHARRKSTLFCVLAVLLALGNCRASGVLCIRDTATAPGTAISGTVQRILSPNRVSLDAVRLDGVRGTHRPVVVTLMTEEDAEMQPIYVGQQVYGIGRLFEQQAVRNPGGIDRRIQALCSGYELSGYLLPGWIAEGNARFSVPELFRRAREALSARIAAFFGQHAPLFQALMLGDREGMDAGLTQAMRLTGIAHLLTVSGMHLSLVAYALRRALRGLPLGRHAHFLLQAILLTAFTCLTGCAPGTVRACLMALIRELAAWSGRRYDGLTALGASALMMTLAQPVLALDTSFQFSFFVVLGILLLSGQLRRWLDRREAMPNAIRRLLGALSLSACAQTTALPMQLALYGFVPLLALPMNLLGGMLMPVLLLGGFAVLALSPLSESLALALARLLSAPAALLETASFSAAAQDWGILRLPAPYRWSLVLFALLMAAASTQVSIRRRRGQLCAALVLALVACYVPRLDAGVRYVQLDVGQGDGALVCNGRHAVLIDVGTADDYAMLRYLRSEGLFVDLVILSHLDVDHAGALGVLLDSEVQIGRIAMATDAMAETPALQVSEALALAQRMGIAMEEYERGDVITAAGFSLRVLSPDETLHGSNERSLVLAADIGGMSLLTLGDLPADCEMADAPESDVLKVAHHGSRYATSTALIEQVHPAVAIISVGRNSYGHPTQRVLDDLVQSGAQVLRTDLSGCITVRPGKDGCLVGQFIK